MARILKAAKTEFAQKGLGGARVDVIARRAKSNKRMLYHYFGNKDDLFRITIEKAYADFRDAEANLDLANSDPVSALKQLVSFTWQYYLDNPELITLVNSENLHKARHIKKSRRTRELNRQFVARMQALLDRGVSSGVFRKNLDPVQVNISIAALGYYYLTNRYTGAIVFERNLMGKSSLAARLEHNINTIMRLVCTASTIMQLEATGT